MFRMTTLALLIGSPSLAWAQDNALILPSSTVSAVASALEDATSITLDKIIESGSRLNLSARENPDSVSVTDRATMERRGVRNFQDGANALPGVNVSAPLGWGGYVAYRGFNSFLSDSDVLDGHLNGITRLACRELDRSEERTSYSRSETRQTIIGANLALTPCSTSALSTV